MKVAVVGLWHLGPVTAACLADAGHDVVGFDADTSAVRGLQIGRAPLFEPGLDDALRRGLGSGALHFTAAPQALSAARVTWITYDTPVDDEDRADVDHVIEQVSSLFPYLATGSLVLVSSQLPVGSTRRMERLYADRFPTGGVSFAYSPENLRLGKAIEIFTKPDRVVVGVRTAADRKTVCTLLAPFTANIEWMSVESAEMTKHALNAFLAISVAFINELAGLCERVGASARDVARGLKTEQRIGPRAYLNPGTAFTGGTLARDIGFLRTLGAEHGLPMHLVHATERSNEDHKGWIGRTLAALREVRPIATVAVWGLTYKAGTSTLRRSGAVELCERLAEQGIRVQAHDPAVDQLPEALDRKVILAGSPLDALSGASVVIVATEWPEYRMVRPEDVAQRLDRPCVIDPSGFLRATLGSHPAIRYATVGEPS